MGVMEGRDSKHIRARFEDIYRPALLANWKIWPAAQVRQLFYGFSIFRHLADAGVVLVRWRCGAIVCEFLVYALALPRAISTDLWHVLDAVPVTP
jgi:hypothetical protein